MSEMKRYRVIVKEELYYSYEVEAETEVLARIKAVERMESGNWGKQECGDVNIFDMEVVK